MAEKKANEESAEHGNSSVLARRPLSDSAKEMVPWWAPSIPPWKPIKSLNSSLRIGAIVSDALFDGLRFEGNVMLLTPDNWQRLLKHAQLDMLIVESTWETATGHWYLAQNTSNESSKLLREIVAAAREGGVPTVYWITEDHVYHEHYRDFATYFDHVFCADPEESALLRSEGLPAKDLLPCVQPAIYNPFRKHDEYDALNLGVLFDGWAEFDRYPEDFEILSEIAESYRLSIIESRYFLSNFRLNPDAPLYDSILGCVSASTRIIALKYAQVYSTFDRSLSTATTQKWRALEAAASYLPIVHLGEVFDNDIRKDIVKSFSEPVDFLVNIARLQEDELYRKRSAHTAWRFVLMNHTFSHRVQEICQALGIRHDWDEYPKASIVTPTCRPEYIDIVFENFERQNYPNAELILITNGFKRDLEPLGKTPKEVKIQHLPGDRFAGAALNYGAQLSSGAYCFRMDDDDFYAENYLLDLMLALRSVEANILGKPMPPPFRFENEQRVYLGTKFQRKAFAIAKGEAYSRNNVAIPGNSIGFQSGQDEVGFYQDKSLHSADLFFRLDADPECTVMLVDGFNSVAHRRSDLSTHTWRGDNEKLKRNANQHPHISDLIV